MVSLMSALKICKLCKREALQRTIESTGGYCMSCYKRPEQSIADILAAKPSELEVAKQQGLEIVNIFMKIGGYSSLMIIPVAAVKVHGNCYKILDENPDEEHEPWPFECGEIVECKLHYFSEDDDPDWLAFKKCEH